MWYLTQAVPLPQVIHCFGNRKDLWGRQEVALPIRPVNLVVEDVLRTSESAVTDWLLVSPSPFFSSSPVFSEPGDAGSGLLPCPRSHSVVLPLCSTQRLSSLALYLLCTSHYSQALLVINLPAQVGDRAIHFSPCLQYSLLFVVPYHPTTSASSLAFQ